jgi:hypothetical protein
MKTRSLEYKLRFAERALSNAMASDLIKNAVADFGYDEKRMLEGQALYEKANKLYVQQIKEYSEQFGASQALKEIYEEASQVYMTHVKIARMALRDDFELYLALQLKGSRERTYDKWFAQANAFYTLALDNKKIQDAMAYLGITKKKLEDAYSLIKKFQQQANVQRLETGDAQRATLLRDEAVEELDDWIGDFIAVSRIAMEEDPKELEKLGLVMK